MTTSPFEPAPEAESDGIPAADPGRGAPETAPGYGAEGHEPDPNEPAPEDENSGER
ncbi:hypothetical protein [Prauserella muralis]|uniref:hypothetical protein n=1 Tax=Prauserella muralis TaxID=588067 RepID=UPI0014743A0C|nr:hypothetical protein [Prauserella muralis]